MHYAEGRLIKESEKFRKRYFAIHHSKRKREETEAKIIPSASPEGLFAAPEPVEGVEGKNYSLNSSDSCSLNKGQSLVLEAIKANEGINVPRISEATGIPSKSIERHIKALIERSLITHQGSKKTGGYYAK